MKRASGIVSGGRNIYGFSVGILMLDTLFPRIPGEIGNARTWDFPVLYKRVTGASVDRVIAEADPTLLQPFVDAANELAASGVGAVTTSCGFLAMFQKEMAAAVSVPVFTSSLMMAPLISKMLRPDQKIGVLTVNSRALGEKHFRGVGIEDVPLVVHGMEATEHFAGTLLCGKETLDVNAARREHVTEAQALCREHPEVGAIILECTNMPPYAADIREATGLPVFDIVSLVNFVANALPEDRL